MRTTLWSRSVSEQALCQNLARYRSSQRKLLRMPQGEELPLHVAVGSGGAVGRDRSPTRTPGITRFI